MTPIINSILDTDHYKLTMGQAFQQFPYAEAHYAFTNRGKKPFRKGFGDELREQVNMMADLSLSGAEYDFLKAKVPYLKPTYLEWLKSYRFNPNEVHIEQDGEGQLSVDISGPLHRTTYWEVPLMAVISELHFLPFRGAMNPEWRNVIRDKAAYLAANKLRYTDFSTRRRFSKEVQEEVVFSHSRDQFKPWFMGTSNPYFAMKYGFVPKGTLAHEWIMAMMALYGVGRCNTMAMEHWQKEFQGQLGIMLTDTVTTDVFLETFDVFQAKLWDGVRHDSEDPFVWGEKIIAHYIKLGIDPNSKILFFSDALTPEKYEKIARHFEDRITVGAGIGTNLSNDVGYSALNMVIKATKFRFGSRWIDVFKLSDSRTKHMGILEVISFNKKYILGISERLAA